VKGEEILIRSDSREEVSDVGGGDGWLLRRVIMMTIIIAEGRGPGLIQFAG
jgi:hypothetical protein